MTVATLYRYPVKSMLGEAPDRLVITDRGVLGDRAYALLDTETGLVASAKVPKRWSRLLEFSATYLAEPEAGGPPAPVAITFPDGTRHRSDDADIDRLLSAELGREVRLVTVPPEGGAFEELWPDIEGLAPNEVIAETTARHEADTGEVISRFDLSPYAPPGTFFDLSALHVLTESTLARLRELAPHATFDARRYRPNIVLGDTEPGFPENDWPGGALRLGGEARIGFSFSTMRCVMTTLAQSELPRDPETLRAIAKHNRIEIPQLGGKWACAGVYADVLSVGEVHLGDPTEHLAATG